MAEDVLTNRPTDISALFDIIKGSYFKWDSECQQMERAEEVTSWTSSLSFPVCWQAGLMLENLGGVKCRSFNDIAASTQQGRFIMARKKAGLSARGKVINTRRFWHTNTHFKATAGDGAQTWRARPQKNQIFCLKQQIQFIQSHYSNEASSTGGGRESGQTASREKLFIPRTKVKVGWPPTWCNTLTLLSSWLT